MIASLTLLVLAGGVDNGIRPPCGVVGPPARALARFLAPHRTYLIGEIRHRVKTPYPARHKSLPPKG